MPGSATLSQVFPPNPSTERSYPTFLHVHPNGESFVYCSGAHVVVRKFQNPKDCYVYSEHNATVHCARFAPSGFYIASGDARGFVRIWDTTQAHHPLKHEYQVLGGAVKDLAWSPDSKRLVVVGEGRSIVAKAILVDTGSSLGEVGGHFKGLLSCDFKSSRPFMAATCGEDFRVNIHEGPPFKLKASLDTHTNFVNCVRYSPDGGSFATVSSDKKVLVWDSVTGELRGELGPDGCHSGAVLGVCWSLDGLKLVTASQDKSVKVWDASTRTLICTLTAKPEPLAVGDMQMGVACNAEMIVSISLDGSLNLWRWADILPSAPSPSTLPFNVVYGHQVALTAIAAHPAFNSVVTASYDGLILSWTDGVARRLAGTGHSNSVTSMALCPASNKCLSVGMDDTLRFSLPDATQFESSPLALPGQPVSVSSSPSSSLAVVATASQIVVIKEGTGVCSLPVPAPSTSAVSVAISPDEQLIAIGCQDHSIRICQLEDGGSNFSQIANLTRHRGQVSALQFSPDGLWLASGDSNREVLIWDRATWQVAVEGLVFHSTKVTTLAWCENSIYLASGSVDRDIYIWNREKPRKRIQIKEAHKGGVSGVTFPSLNTVISVGADHCIKTWTLTHDNSD